MPTDKDHRKPRQEKIVSLLRRHRIRNQTDLVDRLRKSGFEVTQSSISRDLHHLGVIKAGGRYRMPDSREEAAAGTLEDVARFLRKVPRAGANLTVVHTAIGAAQTVALAVDGAAWPEVVGTVAGDDTLFIATLSGREQRKLLHRLEKIMRSA